MATFTRKNAWNNDGTFANTDLLWYARAVGEMQSRSLNDETSWWFFAAIHGQSLTKTRPQTFNWQEVPAPPNVPTTPLPTQAVMDKYWDQCQHASWFFPPWHRGSLYAIENILREIVKSLNGPADWALPYWNYFGGGNQDKMPPAFAQRTMPDKDGNEIPNPLFVTARFGPNRDGNVFVPIGRNLNQECQQRRDYTGLQPRFYGGGATPFNHMGGGLTGALEYNPHNGVHVFVGGQTPRGIGGLMSKSSTAALDPIFYLHHCNIDRMWAAWNSAGNANPSDANWLSGPTATGDRKFYMPKPDKTAWQFTPEMVNDLTRLDYTYDDLILIPEFASREAMRLRKFGLSIPESKSITAMASDETPELVGANRNAISVDATGARTTVKLDSGGWYTVTKSLLEATNIDAASSAPALPDEVYLELEGIKGNEDSIVCSVSVNQHYAGHLYLFGLSDASDTDGQHGGGGLTIRFDITDIVDELHLTNAADLNSLEVLIQPVNIIAEGNELTIDRVSVYRQGSNTNV